jgi:hypothetical protein
VEQRKQPQQSACATGTFTVSAWAAVLVVLAGSAVIGVRPVVARSTSVQQASSPTVASGERTSPTTSPLRRVGEQTVAYDGRLTDGWQDLGWGPRTLDQGPAKVDIGDWQGWVLGKPGADFSSFATLSVRVRVPVGEKPPLVLVRAGLENDLSFPPYRFGATQLDAERWATYQIPTEKLAPQGKSFDRLLFGATRKVSAGTFVELDRIVLSGRRATTSATTKPSAVATRAKVQQRSAKVALDCAADRKQISKGIYGIAFNALTEESQRSQFSIGATSRRWGGDPTSRYNWKLGNAWNPGHNWYWRNLPVLGSGNAWQTYFANNAKAGMSSALTIPMLGWVAKDTTSYSFPVSTRGKQQEVAPDQPDAGNGIAASGAKLQPVDPSQTSIASTPAFVVQWLQQVKAGGWSGRSPLDMVILDNEPDLWDSSHRDIRTTPTTYDELLKLGVEYATAIRKADPSVKIAGPASWGWWGYFYSAADAKAGFAAKPDRRKHGDQPFLEWYLAGMKAAEQRAGVSLLDILDVHYYPSAAGLYDRNGGKTDPVSNELRVRSTRSLWDPSYKDESWVDASVYLLPRMQEMIAAVKPGTGLSIGEYNFGGDNHISGAIAQAEALGRFGQFGVSSAYLWTHPTENSEQYWGFRSFRNYDGKGSSFGQFSVRAAVSGSGTGDLSVFGSSDAFSKAKTLVFVNRSSSVAFTSSLRLSRCGSATQMRQWTYAGGQQGHVEGQQQAPVGGTFEVAVAPWSIVVMRIE